MFKIHVFGRPARGYGQAQIGKPPILIGHGLKTVGPVVAGQRDPLWPVASVEQHSDFG